jgi:cytochrome c556
MKRLSLATLAVAGIITALPAAAQFAKPEDALKYRKAAFTVMAAHFGRVGAMVNGRAPFDAAAAQQNVEIATMMSKLPFTAFGPGTDIGDTRAKPNVWSDNAKFTAAATKMQDEMAKLNTAAKSGNLDQIKAAFGPVGAACKACHDDFRKE